MTAAFDALLALISSRTGVALSEQQAARLVRELRKRLKDDAAAALRATQRLEAGESSVELHALLSVVSVHKTDLFRDEEQLRALATHVLRPMVMESRPLRLWSAGCSTGEEVATLLLMLAEGGASPESSVLGTDLAPRALEQAAQLSFSADALARVPPTLVERFFVSTGKRDGSRTLAPLLARQARFQQHNLNDAQYPEVHGGFDVIVCRNVLIYFSPQVAKAVINRLVSRLRVGGVLVLSAAEPLLEPVAELTTLMVPGAFFYQRTLYAPPPPAPVPLPRPSAPPVPVPRSRSSPLPPPSSAEEEGARLFERLLEVEGEHPAAEADLRKVLYLSPKLAAARYMLGLLLERRAARADAATEYRRAQSLLEAGDAQLVPFFLNRERLLAACTQKLR